MAATKGQVQGYRFGGFTLDISKRKLLDDSGESVSLSSRAFDVLMALVEHRGETLSKQTLMDTGWPGVVVEENNLNQAISSLRRALGDTKNASNFIQTIPGRGYCFVAEVSRVTQNSSVSANSSMQQAGAEAGGAVSFLPGYGFRLGAMALVTLMAVAFLVFYNGGGSGEFESESALTSGQNTQPLASELVDTIQKEQNSAIAGSIAVLPFTYLNPDSIADHELFVLGLHDEIINQLTKISSLNVISRHSVVALAEQDQQLEEMGRLLRVESVMTGNILFLADQARISLQLLDPRTGVTLWATSYDTNTLNLPEMISLQTDIALNIADALQAEINSQEQEAIETMPTRSYEAYRYNLAARRAFYDQDYENSWQLSRQAIEIDPNFYEAFYNYSRINTVLTPVPLEGMSSQEHFQEAMDAAERMIEIAPARGDGHVMKAFALSTTNNWGSVVSEVHRLQEMGYSMTEMHFYALMQMCLGDFEGAIETFENNLQVEPIDLFARGFLSVAYELAGDRDASRAEHQLGEELGPVWWGDTMEIFLAMGRDEALRDIDDLTNVSPELNEVLKNLDDRELVYGRLTDYLGSDDGSAAEAFYYGAIAAHIGEHELAVQAMRTGLEDVWLSFFYMWLPVFDETRKLESFRTLLEDSGIVDYWRSNGWPEMCQPTDDAEDSFTCDDWRAFRS